MRDEHLYAGPQVKKSPSTNIPTPGMTQGKIRKRSQRTPFSFTAGASTFLSKLRESFTNFSPSENLRYRFERESNPSASVKGELSLADIEADSDEESVYRPMDSFMDADNHDLASAIENIHLNHPNTASIDG